MYLNIQQNFKDQDWLSHREILASKNDVVEKLNITIQKQLPGQEHAYKSIDFILNDDEAVQYPIEFLNFIQTPDLQAPNLILKVDAPIMLIRNIAVFRLCNGTRLIVKKLMQHVIQATVLTVCAKVNSCSKRLRTCVYEDIYEAVLKRIHTMRDKAVPISRPFVIEKALQFAKALEYDQFLGNRGWLEKFKKTDGKISLKRFLQQICEAYYEIKHLSKHN
ncbi:ATP-dependent DNA helicase [Trichonephila clavipes]|nr:ATP-dependent DNA helicase [Trichonephila clavipes]